MRTALPVGRHAALAVVTAMTLASAAAQTPGSRAGEDLDRCGGNHYILCLHPGPDAGIWTTTGSLATARAFHTATLLPNGKVLVAGGMRVDGGVSTVLDSAELYDPTSGTWSATGSLGTPREQHTATLLRSGKVLVAGGDASGTTAELYDPVTGTWGPTGSLAAGHTGHTATLLPDGRVLVVGGTDYDVAHAAELYDPASGTWSDAARPNWSRNGHSATLLRDGRVLVAGGIGAPYDADIELPAPINAELYDPTSDAWTIVGAAISADGNASALLQDGTFLLAGYDRRRCSGPLHTAGEWEACWRSHYAANAYDPATATWSFFGAMLAIRCCHTATLLPDGRVLVVGGNFLDESLGAELYDPTRATWSFAGNLNAWRAFHTATLLPSGDVLVAGGLDRSALAGGGVYFGGATQATAEVYRLPSP